MDSRVSARALASALGGWRGSGPAYEALADGVRLLCLDNRLAPATALPNEWNAFFDVVHQRYVANALRAADWKLALSEFHRVLKPGGALQLVEIDFRYPTPMGPAMKRYDELQASVR